MATAPHSASHSAPHAATQTPSPTAATPVAVPPTPKAPTRTWQEQVANIQRNFAAKTMSCDRDTHRNDNPQWIEEEK